MGLTAALRRGAGLIVAKSGHSHANRVGPVQLLVVGGVMGGLGEKAGSRQSMLNDSHLSLASLGFVSYSLQVIEVRQTAEFKKYLAELADGRAVIKIATRLTLMEAGAFGDVAPVGGGISECRIHYGPGYRLYFVQRGKVLVILLCGGTKRRQHADIRKALQIAAALEG